MKANHETALVNAFVVRRKRRRYVGFLSSPKRREKFLRQLYHFRDFDPAYETCLSGAGNPSDGILAELRRRGAGEACYAISVRDELDGATIPLAEALDEVFGCLEGTILSCVPGKLAYYEGEAPHNRYILDRRGGPTRR